MNQITTITSDPIQIQNLTLYDGSNLVFQMRYSTMQLGWFLDYIVWNNTQFFTQSLRICNSPNMLRQWKNLLTFGLACDSPPAQREPNIQTDFVEENSNLYILTAGEVQVYEAILSQVPAYSSTTSYYIGNQVYDATNWYVSLQNNNLNNATSNTFYWAPING